MVAALRPGFGLSASARWSVYAGLYMLACAAVTALLLRDVLDLFADVIGLPAAYSTVALASPALVVGAVTWWAVVERRRSYTYPLGGACGVLTALLTGLLWTVRFVSLWGFEMLVVPVVSVLVVLVLGVAVVAGALAGLPLMYARRRLDGGLSDGTV